MASKYLTRFYYLMNHKNLKELLSQITTIAVIGASSDPDRDSYKVSQFLIERGFQVYLVNPNENKSIFGQKFYKDLNSIKTKIDMVDVFRSSEYVYKIVEESIQLDIKIIWTQLGVIDSKAKSLAERNGIKFVMNECPKLILSH